MNVFVLHIGQRDVKSAVVVLVVLLTYLLKDLQYQLFGIYCLTKLHSAPKNVTTLFCYNSDILELMLIIFGINVTEKVGNQKVLYYPTSLN